MKKAALVIGCLVFLLGLMAFASPEKKLNKLISKIWKDEPIELVEVQLSDSLKSQLQLVYEIHSGEKLLGYGCYTTAFGCRVGGCAAPSNPDAATYETFDYIVIYDPQLAILQVDIADYGGQYGYEICRAKWLEQFQGKNSGFKLNENVDGITGATVSAAYLIDDLNAVGSSLKHFLHSSVN